MAILDEYIEYCEHKKLNKVTIKGYRTDIEQYLIYIKNMNLDDTTDIYNFTYITSYIDSIYDNYSDATVKRKIASMSAFLFFSFEKGLCPAYICEGFKDVKANKYCKIMRKKSARNSIPKDDLDVFMKYVNKHASLKHKVLIGLFLYAGLRISEVSLLRIRDVDVKNKCIRIDLNNGNPRLVNILNSNFMNCVKSYIEQERTRGIDDWLFVNKRYCRLDEQCIERRIRQYREQSKVDFKITANSLRNTYLKQLNLTNDKEIEYAHERLGYDRNYFKSTKKNELYANERYKHCTTKIALLEICEKICNVDLSKEKQNVLLSEGLATANIDKIQSDKKYGEISDNIIRCISQFIG